MQNLRSFFPSQNTQIPAFNANTLCKNKLTVEFYGKRCILNFICSSYHLTEQRVKGSVAYVHSLLISFLTRSPPKNVYRQMHSNFSYFSVSLHIIVLQELYLLGCCKPRWSSAMGSGGKFSCQENFHRCLLHLCFIDSFPQQFLCLVSRGKEGDSEERMEITEYLRQFNLCSGSQSQFCKFQPRSASLHQQPARCGG